MNDDLINILSNGNKDIDNQKLMAYLSDQLSKEEKHEFEKALLDSEMMNDAVEGLEKFKDQRTPALFVQQLNDHLKKQIEKKKTKKSKRRLQDMPWLYYSIALIILLIVISFVIVWKHLTG